MPQQPLADTAIRSYILLEKTQQVLKYKIARTQVNLIAARQLNRPIEEIEKIEQQLARQQMNFKDISSQLSTYTISIEPDISDLEQDYSQHSLPLSPQQIKAEIDRLEHRRSSLSILAARDNSVHRDLLTRLNVMTQSIRNLKQGVSPLLPKMKSTSTSVQHVGEFPMFFLKEKKEELRDLRSSKDMRATLRHQ